MTGKATVTSPGLHLRIGADDCYAIVDTLTKGDVVIVTDLPTAKGWVFVSVERTGQKGFVASRFLRAVPPPPPDAPPPCDVLEEHFLIYGAVAIAALVGLYLYFS